MEENNDRVPDVVKAEIRENRITGALAHAPTVRTVRAATVRSLIDEQIAEPGRRCAMPITETYEIETVRAAVGKLIDRIAELESAQGKKLVNEVDARPDSYEEWRAREEAEEAERAAELAKYEAFRDAVARMTETMNMRTREVQRMKKERDDARRLLDKMTQTVEEITQFIEDAKGQSAKLIAERDAALNAVQALEGAQAEAERLLAQRDEAREHLADARAELARQMERGDRLHERGAEAEQALEGAREEAAKLRAERDAALNAVQAERAKVKEVRDRLASEIAPQIQRLERERDEARDEARALLTLDASDVKAMAVQQRAARVSMPDALCTPDSGQSVVIRHGSVLIARASADGPGWDLTLENDGGVVTALVYRAHVTAVRIDDTRHVVVGGSWAGESRDLKWEFRLPYSREAAELARRVLGDPLARTAGAALDEQHAGEA